MDKWTLVYLLKNCLPTDHCKQTNAMNLVRNWWKNDINNVADLGCGKGDSFNLFSSLNAKIKWIGLDIPSSPEVEGRTRSRELNFIEYDGINIPFDDESFDMIFCRQVLEHVHYPNELLREVARVLKNDGLFIGSVSQLEPFHSCSVLNWTPYGIKLIFEDAGLEVFELRSGIDGLTLCLRFLLKGRVSVITKVFNKYFDNESPLNRFIEIYSKFRGRTVAEINAEKLKTAGHICFVAGKLCSKSEYH
ncbi:hypothetical protein MSLAZ_2997 [Methanosarcina lacustris Z-7289]|uniref:Methyltransferase type 11 domain-containing protein n=1 Tax=Methanosarcina lacustris Z-7289 TaxID=1434111 RepID=A0A0E3SAJ3_9EURY|nr:class I SAM-dependent methyltransferase [Methanosarcina lacustris]AKB76258.1 hypothetical protein MSLAZ_2997 [Methanosarcina lacustris Z-7289]